MVAGISEERGDAPLKFVCGAPRSQSATQTRPSPAVNLNDEFSDYSGNKVPEQMIYNF